MEIIQGIIVALKVLGVFTLVGVGPLVIAALLIVAVERLLGISPK